MNNNQSNGRRPASSTQNDSTSMRSAQGQSAYPDRSHMTPEQRRAYEAYRRSVDAKKTSSAPTRSESPRQGTRAPSPAASTSREKSGTPRPAESRPARPTNAPQSPQRRTASSAGGRPQNGTQRPAPQQNRPRPATYSTKNPEKRRKMILTAVFVTVLALILGTVLIIIAVSVKQDTPRTYKTYTYRIGSDRTSVAFNDVNRGGIICIDIRLIKDVLGLTESSSRADSVTFTVPSTGNNVVFTSGSAIASVDGLSIMMPTTAIVDREICSVPLETVANIFTGINVRLKNSYIYITPTDETVQILAKSNDALNMIIEFKSNLDAYEEYMNPQGENRDKYLLLVNKQNPLGSNYTPSNLVSISSDYCSNTNANQMNACGAEALKAMLIELWAQTGNYSITAVSGYRSYARQVDLYNGYIEEEMAKNPSLTREQAEQIVLTYSAAPGTSEHQSGLCMDLIDHTRGDLLNYEDTGAFTSTATFNWLKNNAWKFGFILRYPSDKESVTGYAYESWHFRFVGRYHAEKMYRANLTLDEYIKTLE